MSLDNTLLVEVVIAHGKPTPAHLLHEGTPFVFGGFVWHVVDVEFVGDTMNEVKIAMARYNADGKAFTQTMTVSKEFEIQTLWVTQHVESKIFRVEGGNLNASEKLQMEEEMAEARKRTGEADANSV